MNFVKNAPPTLLLVLCAVFWSLGGLFIKQVNLHPLTVAGFRSFFALFILYFLSKPQKPKLGDFNFLTAVTAYAGTVICFSIATKWTTAANAILLQSTAPLFVAPLSFFYLKEKIEKIDFLCAAGILAGLFFFFKGSLNSALNQGDVFGVIAGVFFALFIVSSRKAGSTGSLNAVFWGNVLAATMAIPTLFPKQYSDSIWNLFATQGTSVSNGLLLDNSIFSHLPTQQEWIYLAILGIVQLGLPYFLYSNAISKVTALKANLILLIEPVLNPIWVFIFLSEKPTQDALIGGVFVIASVALRIGLSAKSQPEPQFQ